MSDLSEEPDGATPLDPDEQEGLLPTWIATRGDLNAAERDNVAGGMAWARRRLRRADLFSVSFCMDLHRRMFGDVWSWAGGVRRTERNIGVDPREIAVALRVALDDARHWVDHGTWLPDELAARFHHRLVAIHPFPNGNGRWARAMADLLLEHLGAEPFSWGRTSLTDAGEARRRYIDALCAADRLDITPLLIFVRS